jgi:bifunctional enzyme CysN/CysC
LENAQSVERLLTRSQRRQTEGGASILLTGLPASGKSSTAYAVSSILRRQGRATVVLDGDKLRRGLSADLGFSLEDRSEHLRRCGELALILADSDVVCVMALIAPSDADRQWLRYRHQESGHSYFEVYLDTPLDECIRRDPKGLYEEALRGHLLDFTGINANYEVPRNPDLVLTPELGLPNNFAVLIVSLLDSSLIGCSE